MERTANSIGQERLESWKEIANYLNRSVRTVRRWESGERLPVHRHRHNKGSSVFAYRCEIDAWREGLRQRSDVELPSPETAAPMPQSRRRVLLAGVTLIGALSAMAVGWLIRDNMYRTESIVPDAPRWALVAELNGRSGIEQFSSLQDVLEDEIGNSTEVRVLPRNRVSAALRRMRRDADTPLSSTLSLEVGAREGTVRAVLIPSAEQVGRNYLLNVEIVDPVTMMPIADRSVDVTDTSELLPQFRTLARGVVRAVSQIPPRPQEPRLPPMTTSSLKALQLYAKAESLVLENHPQAAMPLVGLALEQDPAFASAWLLQAWILKLTGAPRDDYLSMARIARDHAAGLSEEERCFIEGTYKHFAGDAKGADSDYRALLKLAPEHILGAKAALHLCLENNLESDCTEQRDMLEESRTHYRQNARHTGVSKA